jgi:hypothetical protein
MSDDRGTLQVIAEHLAAAVAPLDRAFRDDDSFRLLLWRLGWEVQGLPPSYVTVADAAAAAAQAAEALADGASVDEIVALIVKVGDVYRAVAALSEAPPGVDASALLSGLARSLFELLLDEYLRSELPTLASWLELLGVTWFEDVPPAGNRPGFVRTHIDWELLPDVVQHPEKIPADVLGWGTVDFDFRRTAELLGELALAIGLPASVDRVGAPYGTAIQEQATATPERPIQYGFTVPLFDVALAGRTELVAIQLTELPAEGSALPGITIGPLVPEGVTASLPFADGWTFALRAGTDLAKQFAVIARPGEVGVRYPGAPGQKLPAAGFGAALAFHRASPTLLLGQPGQSRLELSGMTISGAVDVHGSDLALSVGVTTDGLALVLSAAGADGFIGRVLGDKELRADVPITLGWSSRTGLQFATRAGLAVTAYPGLDLGVVRLDRIDLSLGGAADSGSPGALALRATTALSGALGPFSYAVDRLGVELSLSLAPGNAGPFDVSLHVAPPSGLGLAIDTPELAGGGFLSLDSEAGRYAGVFELTLLDNVSVKAIAIVTTKLPDGSAGFSLLLMITAEGFTPVPLGLGFTLTGIGGLIALDRTIDVEAVRRGLGSGLLDSVLFAKDPAANPDRILSALDQIFPTAHDRLLIGPLAEIGWGTPTLVKVRLALLLELPDPVRAVVLAALAVLLPDPDDAVVELHVDAIGVLDLGRSELALDASLHHSRLWTFTLTGDLALRLNWGDDPLFLLSVGGFHPRFTPPAGLRRLERLTFSLSGRDNPRIRFESYLAITSNTIQLGARVSLRVEEGGFGLDGGGAFDALVQWSPFGLDVGFEAWVRVFSPAGTLFAAQLKVEVTGPQPWHVAGVITIHLLFFSVDVGVNFTIGAPAPPPLLGTVDVVDLLWHELTRRESWGATLPQGLAPGVTLAPPAGANDTVLLVHPLGSVSVRQKVVPLSTAITRVGAQRPKAGSRSYDIDFDGPPGVVASALTDHFALAQFTELTEDQKLTSPSFAALPAGLVLGPAAAHGLPTDRALSTDLLFETLDLADPSSPASPGAGSAPGSLDLLGIDLPSAERRALRVATS